MAERVYAPHDYPIYLGNSLIASVIECSLRPSSDICFDALYEVGPTSLVARVIDQ